MRMRRNAPWRSELLLVCALLLGCRPGLHPGGIEDHLAGYRCPDCNVLLISIDTLRADHLHVYGYPRQVSPHIDRFAREAVLFDRDINTGGGTLPVHASMFTSLPPTVHGVWPGGNEVLGANRITLAKQLHAAGYRTQGYTGGGFVRGVYGLGQGFDSFYDQGGNFRVELPLLETWLDSYEGGKFFVFLHTYDVHSGFDRLPYDHCAVYDRLYTSFYKGTFDGCIAGKCASELLSALNQIPGQTQGHPAAGLNRFDVGYIMGLYDGGIAYTDEQLGNLFEHLKQIGLWDKTLIVLTADHGEEFLEHGRFLHEQNYEEIARVPLLIRFPHAQFAGRRISELVSTLEVMPTILDAVGITPNPQVEGHSVLPLIASGGSGRGWVYMKGSKEKLRTASWSLIVLGGQPLELYDLTQDPHETRNVLGLHQEVAAGLFARFERERQAEQAEGRRLGRLPPSGGAPLSEEERSRLRSLGYSN
jgi:hypothetical protein